MPCCGNLQPSPSISARIEFACFARVLLSASGQAILKYTRVRAMRRWAGGISLSECLEPATDRSSKQQQFQFLNFEAPVNEDIPNAFHPCGRRSCWKMNTEQFRECCSCDLHSRYTP